jgi:hypothetical protein
MVTACLAVLIDEVFVEGWRGLILQGKRQQMGLRFIRRSTAIYLLLKP